jgi:hypothetical protein
MMQCATHDAWATAYRRVGQAAEAEVVDGAEGAVVPDVKGVVVHVGVPQPLARLARALDARQHGVALLHVCLRV